MATKRDQYNKFLNELLLNKNIKVSSELCRLLEQKFKVKPAYARKIVQRNANEGLISSSKPLTFGIGQFAYYLPGVKLTKDKIKLICKEYRPPLYRLLVAIDTNDGIISYYEALKITASPLNESSTKANTLNELVEILENKDLIYQKLDKNRVKYLILKTKQESETIMASHFIKMSIDTLFIKDILEWLIKSNLIDNKYIVYRNKNNPSKGAVHNNLIWDSFSYTKTTGLNTYSANGSTSKDKQTLVVVDINISRAYEQFDLDGFLSRVQININSVKNDKRKILPIIVYKSCSNLVLNKIKKLGFLCYDIGSIFGSNIFRILENISKLQIDEKLLEDDSFEKIIEDTLITITNSGQEDQLKALKGTLFEVIMYQVLKFQYSTAEIYPNVFYTKNKTNKSEGFEYDFIIKSSNPKEIIVVEVKGYKQNNQIPLGDYQTKNTTNWFFKNTLPYIRQKFEKEITEGYIFKGCYITSSKFNQEAIADLEILNNGSFKPKRLNIYYDREKLFEFLMDNGFENLKAIIEKFY